MNEANFPHNPIHEIGTCGQCGGEMVYNVPRLGANGGFIHKDSRSFSCSETPLQQFYQHISSTQIDTPQFAHDAISENFWNLI